jgi:hypothetical protein
MVNGLFNPIIECMKIFLGEVSDKLPTRIGYGNGYNHFVCGNTNLAIRRGKAYGGRLRGELTMTALKDNASTYRNPNLSGRLITDVHAILFGCQRL